MERSVWSECLEGWGMWEVVEELGCFWRVDGILGRWGEGKKAVGWGEEL